MRTDALDWTNLKKETKTCLKYMWCDDHVAVFHQRHDKTGKYKPIFGYEKF